MTNGLGNRISKIDGKGLFSDGAKTFVEESTFLFIFIIVVPLLQLRFKLSGFFLFFNKKFQKIFASSF